MTRKASIESGADTWEAERVAPPVDSSALNVGGAVIRRAGKSGQIGERDSGPALRG